MARRPLLYGTMSFVLAIGVCYYLGIAAAVFTSVLGVVMLLTAKKVGKEIFCRLSLILVFYIAGTACFYLHNAISGNILSDDAGTISVEGEVLQSDVRTMDDGTLHVQLEIEVSEQEQKLLCRKERVLVNYYADVGRSGYIADAIPGDLVFVTGVVENPSGRRNPGCFDYALYLESIGIKHIIKAQKLYICEVAGRHTLTGRMHIVRESFLRKLELETGRDISAMMGAVLFGCKDNMDEEVIEEFQKNGTAHILAVSGLHIGIIYGVITGLWKRKKGLFYFASVMLFFICYAALASFSPSVVRAVIMIGLHMASGLLHKKYDLSSAAFFAALVMLVKNPMYLFNTGFQMSFLAVLTMAMMIPVVKRIYSGMFLAGVSIQIGLMPYIAYVFNYFSPGAVVVNVPVVFIAGILVPVGVCSVALSYICGPLFGMSAQIIEGLCHILTGLNHVTAVEGISVFSVVSPDIRVIALYYLSMLFFISEEGRLVIIRRKKAVLLFMVSAVMVITLAFGAVNKNEFKDADVVFVDVGQGDCIHFRTEEGGNYLIDGGGNINYNVGKKILKPYLLKNGVKKLDGIFVTHLHTDHYKGAAELCREGMSDKLFVYEGNRCMADEISEDTGLDKERILYLYAGQHVELSQKEEVHVLWPERKSDREYMKMQQGEVDENETSLIFKVKLGDSYIVATGDADEECQKNLDEKWHSALKCDVLKVAHHGSKYSYCDDFVKDAAPKYAVFQVGKNNFGHPDKGVVENYRRKGIIIYRNDRDGAVAFKFEKNRAANVMTVRRDR